MLKAVTAVLAIEARVGEPLDTDTVTELDGLILSVGADGDDDTNTLQHKTLRIGQTEEMPIHVPRDHR